MAYKGLSIDYASGTPLNPDNSVTYLCPTDNKDKLAAIAKQFDGRVYGVNLPETAIDLDEKKPPKGFSCDNYFAGEMENLAYARKAFSQSHVVQYVNFWPSEWNNDRNYMGRLFAFASANNIGLGGPDIVPNRKAHMKNAYPFFNQYKDKLHSSPWPFRSLP